VHRGLSLEAAQAELREGAEGGTRCPCCGQHAQVYRRKLNASMAHALVVLFEASRRHGLEKPVHVRSALMAHSQPTGDYCYLVHWHMLEKAAPGSKELYPPGHFRLTERGARFVRGEEAVPEAVFLYGEQVLGFSEKLTTLKEALGQRFSLEGLQAGGGR
jgi:hypothetical protein